MGVVGDDDGVAERHQQKEILYSLAVGRQRELGSQLVMADGRARSHHFVGGVKLGFHLDEGVLQRRIQDEHRVTLMGGEKMTSQILVPSGYAPKRPTSHTVVFCFLECSSCTTERKERTIGGRKRRLRCTKMGVARLPSEMLG